MAAEAAATTTTAVSEDGAQQENGQQGSNESATSDFFSVIQKGKAVGISTEDCSAIWSSSSECV